MSKLQGINAADNHFFAEEVIVKITPKFEHPKMNFISVRRIAGSLPMIDFLHPDSYQPQGDFGPFESYIETEVPLWLAIALKQSEKCQLHKPEWLSLGKIHDKYIAN